MAELALSFATGEILKRVGSLTARENSRIWGFEETLEKLKEPLIMIEAMLQYAERRQATDEFVRRWLEKLRDVAYGAEDVLDEFDYEIRRKVEIQNSVTWKVRSFFSLPNPIVFRLRMGLKFKRINESLYELNHDAISLGVLPVHTSPQLASLYIPWLLNPEVHNLDVLKLGGCNKCKQLPRLGHLSHLKIVEIERMNGVEVIGVEFYSSGGSDMGPIFPALERLSLVKMKSLVEWMIPQGGGGGAGVVLPCLEKLYIKECWKLKSIPALGHLPRLEIVEMERMVPLRCIGNEFYSSSEDARMPITLFPALKRLSLKDMWSLEEWTVPAAAADGVQAVFPCLEELYIKECYDLKSIPSMTHLSSKLVKLDISGCDELSELSGEFHASTSSSLKYLSISDCGNLASVPSLQHCTALEELYINECPKLVPISLAGELQSLKRVTICACDRVTISLPIRRLLSCPSLEELIIRWSKGISVFEDDYEDDDVFGGGGELLPSSRLQSLQFSYCDKLPSLPSLGRRRLHSLVRLQNIMCPSLRYLPEDFFCSLTQLKRLEIGGFSNKLQAFPGMNSIQHLSGSLEELKIWGWKKLKSIPHQLQHLTSLKKLEIRYFDGEEFEEALPDWLGSLSSLQRLSIERCSKVKYLPSSTAMQRLSKLTSLHIGPDTPLLKRNCAKGRGSEWPKISHIPNLSTWQPLKLNKKQRCVGGR